MKRSVLLVTAAAVALTPLAASAAPAKPRTLTFDYAGPATLGHSAGLGLNASAVPGFCDAVASCWEFSTVKGEKTVEIAADDPSVGITVWFDGTYADTSKLYCGTAKLTVSPKTTHAISVRPTVSDCGGVPSGGTLTATISAAK